MPVLTGLDRLVAEDFASLRGKSVGLVCNQASITKDIRHVLELMLERHRRGDFILRAVFGPQHGLFGHTQDNMIEWEGETLDDIRVFSLYGAHREPTAEMLEDIEELVVDLQDVGSRYYTFVWTMAACMKVCEPLGIPVTVLDRPNPIGGVQIEGPILKPGFESFVGAYPIPIRHGMTIGEIASHLKSKHFPESRLEIVPMEGWNRAMYFEESELAWALPSPNMPSVETAVVYPGACLLEATNMSEGRGTTRPFEMFGAPYLDSWTYAAALNDLRLSGCIFRAVTFEPTFNKHVGKECGGCYLHVTDRSSFEPVLTYVAVMQEAIRQAGFRDTSHIPPEDNFVPDSPECRLPGFAWKLPPYEYVHDRRPIDILTGDPWLSEAISNLKPLAEIRDWMKSESESWHP
jgi:uncharacterized protein YbbC (DUF1343 family)